jgi:crotonobetainyl-CoA:carnitine CoA-transferase CaiB-like acyl-CoA transferase
MAADPQVQHRAFFVPYERFDTPMPGNPIHMSGLNSSQWTPCPRLGQHNREVLADWLNYDESRIDELISADVLRDRPPG